MVRINLPTLLGIKLFTTVSNLKLLKCQHILRKELYKSDVECYLFKSIKPSQQFYLTLKILY